jgi:glutathione S-transferase
LPKEEIKMKLYVAPPSPRALKVMALKNYLGLDCELCYIDFMKGDNHRPEYAALNPNERMPVLEHDGYVLWESNAILRYMVSLKPDSGLWPADAKGQAEVIRWMSWEGAHWAPACGPFGFERVAKKFLGLGAPDAAAIAKVEPEFHKFANVLNLALKGRKWLTGNDLTIADFSVGAWMTLAAPAEYPLAKYPEITRWYDALASLPGWKELPLAAAA